VVFQATDILQDPVGVTVDGVAEQVVAQPSADSLDPGIIKVVTAMLE
jgi:hypothetical protein